LFAIVRGGTVTTLQQRRYEGNKPT